MLTAYRVELEKLIEAYFLPVYYQKLEQQSAFIDEFDHAIKELMSINYLEAPKKEALCKFTVYKKFLEKLSDKHFKERESLEFDKEFTNFNKELLLFIEQIDEVVIEPQKVERYKARADDALLIKTGKSVKRLIRNITGLPLGAVNMTRKLFKKAKLDRKDSTHQIKVRNLARYFLKEKLSEKLAEQQDKLNLTLSKTIKLLWTIDNRATQVIENYLHNGEDIRLPVDLTEKIPEARNHLENCKEEIKKDSLKYLADYNKLFLEAFDKVGTFELSNRRYRPAKSARLHYKLNQQYKSRSNNWNNMLRVLSDDWEIDLELYAMIYHGLEAFYTNSDEIETRINDNINTALEAIIRAKRDVANKIKDASSEKADDIEKTLKDNLQALNKALDDQLIPEANEVILLQDLPALINAIEAGLGEEMQVLSTKRTVVKGANYEEPIKSSSISVIAPGDLINFESWPQFQSAVKACKVKITAGINNLQHELSQLGQIAAFNLESAITLVHEANGENKPKDVAIEGLERAIKKTESLKELLREITTSVNKDLYESLKKLNESLEQLTDNENIYQIRVRIAKAKAIERSKKLKNEWVERIKNFWPFIWKKIKTTFNKVKAFIEGISERYGLSKEKADISYEIADFLTETQQSIDKLPFVYQRLFKSEPLNDQHLFEGRTAELNALNNAYNNFLKGRFVAISIVAEKGSGTTTLLNFFQKELTTSCDLFRLDISQCISTEEELLQIFSNELGASFKTSDELVSWLLEGKKKVIILENLQKMFLKKVNGFKGLTKFLEIISLTSHNVCWVVTCTLYAWNYLNKTWRIADNFSHHVTMKEFENEVITQIISKRHQISGYNLIFEPSPSHLNNKKFKKMEESEQQKQLQKEYFNDLNKIAKSNISLALMYWLRSTREVTDTTINIASLKEMNFAFMQSLPADRVHALTYFLLHDGLTEEQFAQCINKDKSGSRSILFPLYEDGILVKKGEVYLINPLLYRQTVELLKTKNILH